MSKKNKAPETLAEETAPADNSILPWVVGIGTLVVVLGGFAAAVAVIQGGSKEPIRLPEEELKPAAAAKPEPAPWTYDSVTDQHFNPEPGHKHWHKGHPPNQNAAAPKPIPNIPNPEPWQYDAATDQHFNPEPGHNHWHGGKPPANQAAPVAATDSAAAAPVTEAPAPAPAAETAPVVVEEAVEVPTEPVQTPAATPAP